MDDKKYKVTYEDKTWEGKDQIFTLSLFANSRQEAREMAEELTFSIMILRFQTKIDWFVRCKLEHAEKETETVYSSI
jgi:hypothetical protein